MHFQSTLNETKTKYKKRSITAGVILGAADFVGQALENNGAKESDVNGQFLDEVDSGVDIARVARFAFFGFILQVRIA